MIKHDEYIVITTCTHRYSVSKYHLQLRGDQSANINQVRLEKKNIQADVV